MNLRSFAEYKQEHGAMDFQDAPDGSVILAHDQFGDTFTVLHPDGTAATYTSDGNVIPMTDVLAGESGWAHLHRMLTDQLMWLG